ncbi:MAG: methyltransferase family protein [Nocardioidaceae bacterium]
MKPPLVARMVGGVILTGAAATLLSRMRADFERHHRLRTSTTVMVYSGYAVHAATLGRLACRPVVALPIPATLGRIAGATSAATGAALLLAGADAFGSARQLSGTDPGELVTDGIYRRSRNPQYLAHLLTSTAVSLAGRSADGVALTAATAVVFNHWIRREEDNLRQVFGQPYRTYQDNTARWLGRATPRGTARG